MTDARKPPIDPALLEPVVAALGRSRTLPAEAYLSEGVLEWERRNFFERTWVTVGRSSGVASPGDQMAARVGGESVLLLRGEDGTLRGFYNVCRHRGHELLPVGCAAHQRVVKCPYHAWRYRLNGTFLSAPRFEFDPEDPAREGLVPVPVEEWHGWVFVNASGDGGAFIEHVGRTLDALLAPYDPGSLMVAASHSYEIAANWKLVVENYHECYHCTSIHPELCRVTPPDSGENYRPDGAWAGGSMDLREDAETMSLSGAAVGRPLPGISGDLMRQVFYYGLFPNLLISPHPDYVLTHRVDPLTPASSRIECQWLFPQAELERPDFDPSGAVELWDVTNRQDWSACESVQRGMTSRGSRQGPLSPWESASHQFLLMVANGYLDGLVSPPRVRERA